MSSPVPSPQSDNASATTDAPTIRRARKFRARAKPVLGNIAITLGIIGLLLSLYGGDLAESIQPLPSLSERVADYAVHMRDTVVTRLLNRSAEIAPPPSYHWHYIIPRIALGFAVGALILGLFSIIRGETKIPARAAMYMGTIGIAWYGMMVIASISFAIVFILAIMVVLGELGFDLGGIFSVG